jgi:hypothetical protein
MTFSTVAGDRLSSSSASESGQSGGRTEDRPVDPVAQQSTFHARYRRTRHILAMKSRSTRRWYPLRARPARVPAADREDQLVRQLKEPQVQGGGCAHPVPVERCGGRAGVYASVSRVSRRFPGLTVASARHRTKIR